jgi:hypothetical protein
MAEPGPRADPLAAQVLHRTHRNRFHHAQPAIGWMATFADRAPMVIFWPFELPPPGISISSAAIRSGCAWSASPR